MADTRSFEERQRDLIGVDQAARLVGVEQIERARKNELRVYALERALQRIANPLPCDCDDGVSECYCMTQLSSREVAQAALAEHR